VLSKVIPQYGGIAVKRKLDSLFDGKHQNDDGRIKIAGLGTVERTRIALNHNRSVYRVKLRNLGACYEELGERVWQILCETYLHDIAGTDLSVSDVSTEILLSESQMERYIFVLEAEGWLTVSNGPEDMQTLNLTELGISKAEAVMEGSADSFNKEFIYSTPTPVPLDD
jgi:DNA-binding MarR family transcriptional regulator